jgi:hypothetical protein
MYVIDESSYRIDKTSFPTKEEATQRAAEASRILGRAINVYELLSGELHFAFRVMPDGTTDSTNPLDPQVGGEEIKPASPAVLGSFGRTLAILDDLAETFEARGNVDLAVKIDKAAAHARKTGNFNAASILAARVKAEVATAKEKKVFGPRPAAECYDYLLKHGFKPEPGNSRYRNSKGEIGRIEHTDHRKDLSIVTVE